MDKETMNENVIRYFQGSARDFTPIAVSANFAALLSPVPLNRDEETREEFDAPTLHAA